VYNYSYFLQREIIAGIKRPIGMKELLQFWSSVTTASRHIVPGEVPVTATLRHYCWLDREWQDDWQAGDWLNSLQD